jgi:hypothetical protein
LASHLAGLYCAVQSNAEESPEPILPFAMAAAAFPEKLSCCCHFTNWEILEQRIERDCARGMLSSVSESLAQSADISGGLGGQHLEGDPSRENALVSTNKHHFPPGEEHIGRAVTP